MEVGDFFPVADLLNVAAQVCDPVSLQKNIPGFLKPQLLCTAVPINITLFARTC